ncbi:hypothetical protein P691DRAFT_775559 [Macrolepiota fuliginosa MF-IS2]|uniref:MutL C-terminal dimerisation domain-containing protein n=1 Tax=Macrolepiota fuliginosa MF-IS2 TaxID=1400762 RepID=A0A9P5XBB9_9AGAR|nr:hypothetical protein P691DRAFT_775559 [Macrolepiota fuliginosa MF-IS2]
MQFDQSCANEQQPAEQLVKLDEPTQAKIRSTQILTTLPQIVSELLQNSLDAKAGNIDIGINCEDWMCWVRDDGSGISRQDLETFAAGDSDMRYHTSKEYALGSINAASTFGFRGEALASAAQISCLEIASRSVKARTTWSVIRKGNQVLYKGEAVRWRRESPGTVVCVRDAFFNLPVRRRSHPSVSKTWELVRREIEIYALVSPSVSFTLEDLHRNRENGVHNRMVRIPKTSSTLATFRHLYGRALAERVETIAVVDRDLKAEGFISLHGASSKIYQFLDINSHPIVLCDLHKVVDAQFSSSSFGKNSLDDQNEGVSRTDSRRSPRKTEKKLVYMLNISVPPGEVYNDLDPTKSTVGLQNKPSVVSFLEYVIRGFLTKHGFIHAPIKVQLPILTHPNDTSRKRRRIFTDENHYSDDVPDGSSLTQIPNLRLLSLKSSSSQVLDDSEATPNRPAGARNNPYTTPYSSTGPFLPSTAEAGFHDPLQQDVNQRRTLPSLQSGSRSSTAIPVPKWLHSALQANDSYSPLELKIPSACSLLVRDPQLTSARGTVQRHSCQSVDPPSLLADPNPTSSFFTRDELSLSRIIGQVDLKFIACLILHPNPTGGRRSQAPNSGSVELPTSAASTLVLVDQHAADERVRVESFLKELCLGFLSNCDDGADTVRGIRLRILTPPKPILVTSHELRLLEESIEVQEAFRNWGFRFAGFATPGLRTEISSADCDKNGYGQILVEAIPEVVSDKLLQENELQGLVKGFLAQLQTDLPSFSNISDTNPGRDIEKEFLWLKALRYCPRPLLDLINSKACRGAIMFNDTLTVTQCEDLVQRLSKTAYPFQCAHGRPSLVPLIELGPQTGSLGPRQVSLCDWSKLED